MGEIIFLKNVDRCIQQQTSKGFGHLHNAYIAQFIRPVNNGFRVSTSDDLTEYYHALSFHSIPTGWESFREAIPRFPCVIMGIFGLVVRSLRVPFTKYESTCTDGRKFNSLRIEYHIFATPGSQQTDALLLVLSLFIPSLCTLKNQIVIFLSLLIQSD